MGWVGDHGEADREASQPLTAAAVPKDDYNIAYIIFFILGAGFLLPWNSFISAVDYFDVLYPNSHVDRVFSLAYMVPCFTFLLILTFYGQKYSSRLRINTGLFVFLAVFILVPVMDEVWITGSKGTKTTHVMTVAAACVLGLCDALVQGSLVGAAGELPERYMQALFAGTAASGVLASLLRVITKASMSQTVRGLRLSADVYFIVTGIFLLICLFSYNLVYKLPIMLHYNSMKIGAMESTLSTGGPRNVSELGLKMDTTEISLVTTLDSELTNFAKPVSYWHVWSQIQWLAISVAMLYVITLTIFPGYISEDVHSAFFGDWYPVLLIATYNSGDLTGKILTSVYMLENQSFMVRACFGRIIFIPLFYAIIHGPAIFRTEAPVFLLTFLLGLSNGYLTSVVMIVAPKNVSILEAETAGIIMTLFLATGLCSGSLLGWVWII
ncbi:equilibrative nucleotide transporter 8 [Physcomitrium patens]|uniref:Uncharacterized protein n=1 Tax=Physcomitrium patens TaxID=3218 RepID=A0A2K1IW55_PHYPA|nr:equilibrative nucleotide transporter 8-like [Physcomitrium patens]XP_024357824.1 equilibrative nucleotide transporter 8-like [Physcomitrium patens]XP_024357825.1 equilibrative nucleotide transporter 8-like [Physcomitrium patens]XP_024357826.1 equilibrative nucleotide transporter 8-like [Physcomitrium patens]XP_024357827.1 equilibrative nucleotide transporter 8-like [Physcomitrium patens]PNR33513.1 hypothetical protein PHYPA_025457 [Physcomitrium patens]|eukprot:XP_024357823.1 equilibrative nucleotide transporter 8-like [Physcomitrella patens]